MLKTFIFCKNSFTAQTLTNKVISNIERLRLVGFSYDSAESILLIEKSKPNLIITFDRELILLIRRNFKHYNPAIVLIDKNTEEPNFHYKNLLIIHAKTELELIEKKISNFINDKLNLSKSKHVIKILSDIGFDLKLTGTKYLIDAILYTNTYKGAYTAEILERDIYPEIAQIYNVTPQRIKWAINRSINYMYQKHTKDTYYFVEQYCAIEYPYKPTPKLIINAIANSI